MYYLCSFLYYTPGWWRSLAFAVCLGRDTVCPYILFSYIYIHVYPASRSTFLSTFKYCWHAYTLTRISVLARIRAHDYGIVLRVTETKLN
uniref:Putative secreted protein n=1 Tax=Anopheles darlingi TaxID=43151 RepID=A0A2M4DCU3_ANODA